CLAFAGTSWADTFTYTFDAPNFTLEQNTPMLNVPPNIGAGTFTTSFTSLSNDFTISSAQQNGLISGQALLEPISTAALTLNFSAPVSQISFVFAINIPAAGPAGFLKLITPSSLLSLSTSVVGGGAGFQGGTFNFAPFLPFSTATIQGFQADGITPTQIEIDNLTLVTAT